jgi:hypothetical protein
MYNGIKNQTDLEKGRAAGGMSTPRGFKPAHLPGEGQVIPHSDKPVKVYKPFHGQGMGPIYNLPQTTRFYDLLVNPDLEGLRYESFEDWTFPILTEQDNQWRANPVRNIHRGSMRVSDAPSQITENTLTQYLYVVLNPSRHLVQSFGEFPGSVMRASDYLVCVEVGNPVSGRLDAAFIQYALPLNKPVRDCIQLATVVPTGGSYTYLYKIVGDGELEKDIFDRWFNSGDYYFNSVIYPKVRGFGDR